MAKFVCDYEKVVDAGEKIRQNADSMTKTISSYAQDAESTLSGWSQGTAKSSFSSSLNSQAVQSQSDAEYLKAVGDYVVESANAIQKLEEEFASMDI